ncbi:HlyD family secretion protein [Thioclava sp. GXIMD2076]|uniref:HlyD family secretion protein n=1 Tax=unclassified Thioclava TaxID=2621713 RepID=UPI0030CF5C4F
MISSLKRNGGRVALTFVMVACAGFLGWHLWNYYMNAPWTRDGRVSADVVQIAPEVAGRIDKVAVKNDQFVHAGDLLFEVDPSSFKLAVEQAQAELDSERETMELKASIAHRNDSLTKHGTISVETNEEAQREAAAAAANVRSAKAALAIAQLDLQRVAVRAPTDGYVTNLHLRQGDYAVAGTDAVNLVDAKSFRITGYFRETQLPRITLGAPVSVKLMGARGTVTGHVASFGRGVADSNSASDTLGLPDVDPVFEWVRLAQRIPVTVQIDTLPEGAVLSAGMSASVYIDKTTKNVRGNVPFKGEVLLAPAS